MWPSTYLYDLTVWATKCNHRLYLLLFYRFCCFSWCQPIMVNLLNYIYWLTKPSGARIRRNYPFYYCLNGQQTDLSTIRATFLQIKQRSSELDGKLHRDVKLQVNYVTKHLGLQSSFNWGKRSKFLLGRSTSQICWPFEHPFSRKKNIGTVN